MKAMNASFFIFISVSCIDFVIVLEIKKRKIGQNIHIIAMFIICLLQKCLGGG